MKKIPQDIVGDIAILKFKKLTPLIIRKLKAKKFLKENKSIKTVLEKKEGFSGNLRIQKTSWLSGTKNTIAKYRENDCLFKFDINETYFSPRLSNERKIISEQVLTLAKKKKNLKILVMFGGVAPFPITIARTLKKNKIKALIYSNELNKKANEFAKENIEANKVSDYIKLVPGDANNLPSKLKEKFDVILMARPNIKETFLKSSLKLSKKGTIIFYHGFGEENLVLDEIKKDVGKKIGKISIRKAGDIGPYKFRWLARFKVL